MNIKVIGSHIFFSEQAKEMLRSLGTYSHLDVFPDEKAMLQHGQDADAIISWGKPTAALLEANPRLKFFSYMFTGYDGIVLDRPLCQALIAKNVSVGYCPGYATTSVAEFALGGLLLLKRNMSAAINSTRADLGELFTKYMGTTVQQSSIGIVGMGAIGTNLARILALMGAKIYFHTRNPHLKQLDFEASYVPLSDLGRLCSDVIVTASLSQETRGLLGEDFFSGCRKGTNLVNVSRGEIVDLGRLREFLGRDLASQALFDEVPTDGPEVKLLMNCPNFYLSPHIAAITLPSLMQCLEIAVANVAAFVSGTEYFNVPLGGATSLV